MNNPRDTIEITLLDVQTVHIHGSPYFHLTFRTDASETPQQMRINPEAFYADPRPGDRVAVNLLMGTIMGARKIS